MTLTKTIAPTPEINYWIGQITKNENTAGKPAIVFLPGIGERVLGMNASYAQSLAYPQGSEAATSTVLYRMSASNINFPASIEALDYNFVTVAPKWEYESGEILAAIKYALDVLKSSSVSIIANSLGGFGLAIEISKNPSFLKYIKRIVWIVMGPGERANTAKNLALSPVENWFLTAEEDQVTPPQNGINLHKKIVALGGKSQLTVFKKGQYGQYAHQLIDIVISSFKPDRIIGVTKGMLTTAEPFGEVGITNIITTPVVDPLRWATRVSSPIEPPTTTTTTTTEPTTTSTTTTTTTTTKAPMEVKLLYVTTSRDPKNVISNIVDAFYTEGHKERYEASEERGYVKGTTYSEVSDQVAVDFSKAGGIVVPKKKSI